MILLSPRISLNHLSIVSINVPLYGFLVVIMSCLLSNRTTTSYRQMYSLTLLQLGFSGTLVTSYISQ